MTERPFMEAEERGPGLREYLQILRRRWLLMAAVLVTTPTAALLTSLRMTPVYEATTKVEVQPAVAIAAEGRLADPLATSATSLATQVELIRSDAVLERAAKELGLRSPVALKARLDVELVRETQIVEIRAEHEDPERARDRVNAVAKAYLEFRRDRAIEAVVAASEEINRRMEQVRQSIAEHGRAAGDAEGEGSRLRAEKAKLEAELTALQAEASAPRASPAPPSRSLLARIEKTRLRIAELERQIESYESGAADPKAERDVLVARLGALESQRQALPDAEALRRGGGTIIAPARTPTEPVRPNLPRNLLLAGALGVALAVGVAFLAEQLDDRVRNPEEVESCIDAPVLGYVPYVKQWEDGTVAALSEPESGGSEAYRTLRINLRFVCCERPLRRLLVTSAVAEEGKTTTAANLGVMFARAGARTAIVSADLRRPNLHRLFGINGSGGLVSALDPDFPLARALQPTGVPDLHLLGEPRGLKNPTEILGSARFERLIRSLSESADLVLFDAPPVLGIADASVLASRVDGVLLVVNTRQVTRRALSHAAEQVRRAGGRIVGAVINAVEPQQGYGYYYGYYYRQYSDDGRKQPVHELSHELEH